MVAEITEAAGATRTQFNCQFVKISSGAVPLHFSPAGQILREERLCKLWDCRNPYCECLGFDCCGLLRCAIRNDGGEVREAPDQHRATLDATHDIDLHDLESRLLH